MNGKTYLFKLAERVACLEDSYSMSTECPKMNNKSSNESAQSYILKDGVDRLATLHAHPHKRRWKNYVVYIHQVCKIVHCFICCFVHVNTTCYPYLTIVESEWRRLAAS